MFDSLFHLLSDSPQAYFILFGVALGDAIFPVLPSESAVILAGLLCVVGDLSLPWVIAVAAAGAFVAAVGWAVYAAVLGYLGGRTFHDKPWLALLIALGIAFAIAFLSEASHKIRERA